MNQLATPGPVQALLLSRMIGGAMLMGLLTFMGVAWSVGNARPPVQGDLAILLSGISALTTMTAFLVPDMVISQQAKRLLQQKTAGGETGATEEALVPLWLNRQIITYGLLEGGGLLNGIGYLLTSQMVSLLVMGVIAALFLTTIPSARSQQDWIARQLEQQTLTP